MGNRWFAATAGLLVAGVVVLSPGLALGQATDPVIAVDQVHPAGSSVHYYVRITSEATGDPVNGATVSATPTSPDGVPGSTVELTPADDDGRYQGPVSMPDEGSWTITFASNNPDASLRYTQEVPATELENVGAAGDEDEEGISNPIVLVLGGVFLVLLAAIGVWAVVAGRKPTDAADGEGGGAAPAGAAPADEPAPPDASGRKPGRTW